MSANQSNLSASKYGYDMVVGTTQASINATMKQFLLKFDGQEFVKCYVYKQDVPEGQSHFVETDYEAYKTTLGFDPFTIPNGTPTSDERIQKLEANYFAFAFKTVMGLPTSFPLSAIPDVVKLDKGNSSVSYNLFCKEFEILNLEPGGYGGGTWSNLSQVGGDAPWTFTFDVSLDLYSNTSAFASLPQEIQNQIKNLCPGSMFSVQQLYLDLNAPGLESNPQIANLDPTSNAYIYLTRVFLNKYFANMQEQSKDPSNPDGNYLLGYSVKPSDPGNISSVVPTDLNFMVSPYLDAQGNATTQYDLYTLNWLVMTDKHKMPAPVQFEWNWVDASDVGSFNGAMSIKKGTFGNFLNKLLSPSLGTVCLIPSAGIDVNLIKISVSYGFQHDYSGQTYSVVNDGTSKILTYSYEKSASDSDTFVPNWGNITIKTSVQSDIYLEGTTIRTNTTAACWVHLNTDGGVSEGDIVKYNCETNYNIGVDAHGSLTVTMDTPTFKDLSNFDTSTWGQIVSVGTIDGMISSVKNFWSVMKDFLTGQENQILAMLNGSSTWVFPGGETLVFKNAAFSQFQDLTADVTYAEPSAQAVAAATKADKAAVPVEALAENGR